jgi:flagellar L-ring protein precursor FlgH
MRFVFFVRLFALAGAAVTVPDPAHADQLYVGGNWANIATDTKAQSVGDIVTVLIFEAATATNSVRTRSNRETSLGGEIGAGGIDEGGSLSVRGGFTGSGEVERKDRLAATMAAQVVEVLPNGDFVIAGRQDIDVNGEARVVEVRGQIRALDISPDNTIASSRLANAQINYDGKGYVSRSGKPGIINRIFSFLGIG